MAFLSMSFASPLDAFFSSLRLFTLSDSDKNFEGICFRARSIFFRKGGEEECKCNLRLEAGEPFGTISFLQSSTFGTRF
jgi:hypothetical protein